MYCTVPVEDGEDDTGHHQGSESGPGALRHPHVPQDVPLALVEGPTQRPATQDHQDCAALPCQTERIKGTSVVWASFIV